MSEEERQRQIDFLVNWQAQFAADIQQSREEQEERWKKADEKWSKTEAGVRALLALAEIHEREIMEQSGQIVENSKQIAENNKQIAENNRQIDALREAGRETGERLNVLVNTVERIINERRDGGPRQG